MIDYDDADDMLTASLFTGGWVSIAFLVCAAVFWAVAYGNSEDCSKMSCQAGTTVLANHECVCQVKAVPRVVP